MQKEGQVEEALTWYRLSANTGYANARAHAVSLLKASGRTEKAEMLRRYGWEPDGSIADPWEAPRPKP